MSEVPGFLQDGHELEFALLGPSPASYYEPDKKHGSVTEKEIVDSEDVRTALKIVKDQLDEIESRGDAADEEDAAFAYSEMSINPQKKYLAALYDELCKLLHYDDINSKRLRFHNTVSTMLDRLGIDFFIEIDPSILKKAQFGETGPIPENILLTADVTLDLRKAGGTRKADAVLPYREMPEEEELEAKGRTDARILVKKLVDKIQAMKGTIYAAPILKELEKTEREKPSADEVKKPIETVRRGVIRRIKEVERP